MKTWQDLYPEVVKEWSSRNGNLHGVTSSNGKRYWWKCEQGHEWQTTVCSRTIQKTQCPFCNGYRPTPQNNLAALFPKIATEWHPSKNQINPFDVLSKSNVKVWWKCEQGHEWQSSIGNRTNNNRSCPYCAGQKATKEKSLANFTHLVSEIHEKNNVDPKDICINSSRKLWWKCQKGHEWEARVYSRTRNNSGCPRCCKQSSAIEIRIFSELKAIFIDAKHRDKSFGLEIDIYIPSLKIAIEVDGYRWHTNSQETDNKKEKSLKALGLNFFRVRQKPLPRTTKLDVCFHRSEKIRRVIKRILNNIGKICGVVKAYDVNSFLNDTLFRKMLSEISLPKENIANTHSDIIKDWDYDKNRPLEPQHFSYGSGIHVWWICKNGYERYQKIDERVRRKGCNCTDCNLSKAI